MKPIKKPTNVTNNVEDSINLSLENFYIWWQSYSKIHSILYCKPKCRFNLFFKIKPSFFNGRRKTEQSFFRLRLLHLHFNIVVIIEFWLDSLNENLFSQALISVAIWLKFCFNTENVELWSHLLSELNFIICQTFGTQIYR